MLTYALGVATPFVLYFLFVLVRELRTLPRTVRWEIERNTPRNATILRGWLWWLLVRPHVGPERAGPYAW